MDLNCKLIEKTFKDADTQEERPYNVLQFKLADGSLLEVSVKGDKAKLLKLCSEQKKDTFDWAK